MSIKGFLRKYYLGVLIAALGLDFLALELPEGWGALAALFVIGLMVVSLYGFYSSFFLRSKYEQ